MRVRHERRRNRLMRRLRQIVVEFSRKASDTGSDADRYIGVACVGVDISASGKRAAILDRGGSVGDDVRGGGAERIVFQIETGVRREGPVTEVLGLPAREESDAAVRCVENLVVGEILRRLDSSNCVGGVLLPVAATAHGGGGLYNLTPLRRMDWP